MSENTKIEWADHTFNPWTGCTKVSPGCDHCYAEGWAKRSGTVQWGPAAGRRRTTEANWRLPLKWNAQAEREGRRFRVFCASLADVFDNVVPAEWRADLFDLIRRCENLNFLLLTKRVGNVTRMLHEVASLLRSEHGAQAERERGLQAGPLGRAGDRRGWSNLARGKADLRPLDRRDEGDAMRPSAGRAEDAGRLSAGAGDDRRGAALRGSSTDGVAALQGADPAGAHGEPQGRGEGPQPPGQPGTGDVQRAEAARGAGAGRRAPRREGVEAPEGTGVGGGCGVDEAPARERLAGEGHRGTLRHHAEGSLAHLHREDLAARLDLLAWIERWLAGDAPPNVWLGATVVNQEEADRDIPKLLAVPARVRFLSMEPLLGLVDLRRHFGPNLAMTQPLIDWVIVGGESGHHARPMHPGWARSLRDQCAAAGVPFHFKQNGEWAHAEALEGDDRALPERWLRLDGSTPSSDGIDFFGGDEVVYRAGKRAAGRLLDGRTHDEFPA